MVTNIKLTSNDVVDNMEIDDTMIDVIAFVDHVTAKELALNNVHVMRAVLNNGNGRRIQIVAWNKFIYKLEEVSELGNIIKIEGAVCKYVSASSRFNDGNVNFQLEIKEHTILKSVGKYTQSFNSNQTTQVNLETISKVQGVIEIEGAVKNNFYLMSSKYQNFGIGSITNGNKKLEIHITNFEKNEMIHKGHWVNVKGTLTKRSDLTPYLNVKNVDGIVLTKDKKKSMEYLLAAHEYVL